MGKTYDCAVVGAGCWGAWIAFRLRQSRRSVALVDAFGAGNALSSSGGASRVIRAGYGADEVYTRWAQESLPAWKQLFERVGRPGLFQHTGVLWTARPGHPHLAGTRAVFDRLAVEYQPLSSGDMRRVYPQLHFHGEVHGILEPEGGALLASQAVQAIAEEAARTGVDVSTARVLPSSVPGWIDIAPGDRISAGAFVFACGPWLPKLFPGLLGNRIRVTRQAVFYFDTPESRIPVWLDFSDERGAYAIPPLAGKGFKLALDQHGPEFDPDTGSRQVTHEETAAVRSFLRERFPDFAAARLIETEVCQYENTSSGDFLIDRHPDWDNVWLAGGGSGHGFKHGPAVSRYLVEVLDRRAEPHPRFSLAAKGATPARTVY